jgi:hypothetical protein
MPEYAGYQSRKTVDWNSIGKEISTSVDQGLKAREERKAADQKLLTDAGKNLSSWESTQNKSFDNVILNGLDQARNKSLEWDKALRSGNISRNEFQQKMMNLNTSFDSLTQATKNFDQYITSVNEAQKNGELSALGMAKAKINMDALRLSQKTLNVGDNGDMFMVSDTNGTTQNVKNWTNMNNIVDVPIDVPKQVDDVVSKWDFVTKEILGPNGQKTISENPRLNDAYQNAKENLIGSIVDESNPSSVVSVLLDNSNLGYQTYFTGEDVTSLVEKAAKIQEAKDKKQMTAEEAKAFAENYKKNNLIELILNNDGEIMPVVTPKMIVDARGVAESQIEEQLGWKEEVDRGFAPQGGGGGSTRADDRAAATEQKRANEYSRGYVATMDAFGIDPNTNKRIKGKTDFSGLDNRYQYIRTSKGVQIWKSGSFDENGKENKKKSVYVGLATTPKGLAEYAVYGKSTAEAETNYEKGRTQYRGAKGIGGNTSGNKPAAQGAGDDIFGNP